MKAPDLKNPTTLVVGVCQIVLCPECKTIQKAGEPCPNCTYPIPMPQGSKPDQKKRTEQVLDLSYQDEKKEKNLEASIKLISSVVKKLEEQIVRNPIV